ncbi:BrxA/BrxB family bacilliredoxin [Sporosarcina pasteurii]|uniref:Bacillithiol system oxidoreductase, YphP/YqiW family n=1 Tax=Sporosarcina pasteurii TaxID=1474 RepID=A0A380BS49_SPOPA|nr:BrxA/BrxB family bacilliredoxin [Sporosarcina pasteurii]MDS9471244.1 BrxA/BrxB family bacilliredoxin [Sporosarcina pasteurii]QBQ05121.1 BrxA/BrxB family bacilliredoxin [Sporosarcina pasteurii]SUJ06159.1 bacillithiol system oxidoreductase, YphP/YqiW family [Sporosarcina pasteurii]
MNAYEEFMQGVYKPMREHLVSAGFTELTTAEDVQGKMDSIEGSALIVINSVCGCAAGQARPAVIEALQEIEHQPTHLFTVFAGQDKEATEKMREYFPEVPPSSPSIALWKDGALAYFIPREEIEINQMETIKEHLVGVLKQFITA